MALCCPLKRCLPLSLLHPFTPAICSCRYEALFDFGMGADAGAVAADDPDAELVPQLVRKLVLPLAAHMLDK